MKEMKYISYEEYISQKYYMKSELLGNGTYKNYKWLIISYKTHPCAYIVSNENDSIYNKHYNDIYFVDVHGGLTYSEWGLGDYIGNDKWVIGWDYAHYGDYLPYSPSETDKKWTTEEIYENIKDAINDIIEESERNERKCEFRNKIINV